MAFNETGLLNGGPKDPVWIGINTNALGDIFDGKGQQLDFGVDLSHGDGNGDLTENQRNVYIQLLRGAAIRLEKGAKNVISPLGMGRMN